ncbi:DUF3089 domain-containing protein [Pseudofrankia sp. BMG5.36]|uniref:DUF3089 domain-containing protein n=1 Tax=Pseudofrankia sp. BMG5.36 TaxID=1834512 RepID=UPI0008D908EF|nr:DUF3089 domain-containing protein [Pseudofrankia sp. BMG5.36]OHV42819.1 hypothetical protein BCD48_29820 [Pseudofrankia sp. BMG5.36]
MRRCPARPPTVLTTLLLALLLGSACGQTPASDPATAPGSPTNPAVDTSALAVNHPTVWVCRPGTVDDDCAGGLDVTIVGPSGPTFALPFQPAANPPADCFYVYPTVSGVGLGNAPLKATDAEIAMVRAQAARFASVCRVFAPAYQQYTVVSRLQPDGPDDLSRAVAFADVQSAWNDYLLNDNQGRPVVLVGDDQGAEMLLRLLREEIEPDAGQRALLVSALLVGADVRVRAGALTGGDLTKIPACQRHDEFGCVVAYSAYQGDAPADAQFGLPSAPSRGVAATADLTDDPSDLRTLCTNPAALGGGEAELEPYLPTARLVGALLPGLSPENLPAADTGFVTYPEFLTAECRQAGGRAWLAVTPRPVPGGDLRSLPVIESPPSWGLHFAEFSLTLGDLVELAGRQTTAYLGAHQALAGGHG